MRFHCMCHAAAMPLTLLPLSSGSILLSFFLGLFFGFSLSFLPVTSSVLFLLRIFATWLTFSGNGKKKHENFVISNDLFPENEENHENFDSN